MQIGTTQRQLDKLAKEAGKAEMEREKLMAQQTAATQVR